jgi:hypothetical protein
MQQRGVDKDVAAGNEQMAQLLANPTGLNGIYTPEQIASMYKLSPDTGLNVMKMTQDAIEALRKRNEDALPSLTDTNAIRQDFISDASVKNLKQAEPIWSSVLDATTRDTPQADLNIVIGLAKLFDPTSVVREGEVDTVRQTGNLPSEIYGQWKYLTGDKSARLDPSIRKGMLQEGYSRMKGYYDAYQGTANYYTDLAKRNAINPADIVYPFAAPKQYVDPAEEEEDLGPDIMPSGG